MNMLATSPKLVETMQGMAGDQLLDYASQVLGATVPGARRAIQSIFVELVAELTHQSIRAGDAKRIFELVMAPNLYRDVVTNLNALLASERAAEPLLAHGNSLIEQIFGDRVKGLRESIAQEVGLAAGQIGQLLPLAVSVGVGTLKADFRRAQIDARQLKHMLDGQLSIAPAASQPQPRPQAQPEPSAPIEVPRASEPRPLPRFEIEPRRSPLPWILAAVAALVVALLGWFYLRPFAAPAAVAKPPRVSVVEERVTPVPAASPALATPAPTLTAAPAADEQRRVRLNALRFDFGSAVPAPDARDVLTQALRILDPTDVVLVEGHTDASGDAGGNQAIALARARAIAALLHQLGLERNRISVVGRSDAAPIASNETPEGRALNRRVELVITSK